MADRTLADELVHDMWRLAAATSTPIEDYKTIEDWQEIIQALVDVVDAAKGALAVAEANNVRHSLLERALDHLAALKNAHG